MRLKFLLGDNNFPNRIAITFNNLPENIRSQIKFSSFNNLSYRHFMSHDWPYFWHLTDIWSNWQWFCWHSSYSTTFNYWTVSPLFVSFYYFLVTSWKAFERPMLLDNKSIYKMAQLLTSHKFQSRLHSLMKLHTRQLQHV